MGSSLIGIGIRRIYNGLQRKKFIDHYENPRNVGSFDNNDENVGSGMVGAPACGDVMKLQIKVNDEGIIEDARLKLTAAVPLSLPAPWSPNG